MMKKTRERVEGLIIGGIREELREEARDNTLDPPQDPTSAQIQDRANKTLKLKSALCKICSNPFKKTQSSSAEPSTPSNKPQPSDSNRPEAAWTNSSRWTCRSQRLRSWRACMRVLRVVRHLQEMISLS